MAELGIELEGVINIEVNPDSLLERLSSASSTAKQVKPSTKFSTHQLTTKKNYYQREDDKPETVKRRLDVNIAKVNQSLLTTVPKVLVHDIEGNQDINDVFKDIEKSIDKFEIKRFHTCKKNATNVILR